jgi:hypothetical protein
MQMNRVLALRCCVIAFTVVSVVSVVANEKPTTEFQELMRANAAIVDLGGTSSFGKETNIDASSDASLSNHIQKKDYDGIAQDALALKANLEKIATFWNEKKVEDAANLSKTALKAADDLETAAKAKNSAGITAAHFALANACRQCHLAHRVVMLTDRSFQIR